MPSYEGLFLFVLSTTLSWASLRSGYAVQALVSILLWFAVSRDANAAAMLSLPLVLLAERCLDSSMSLGHSPLAFYAAAFLSYVFSFPSAKAWRWPTWVLIAGSMGGLLCVLTGTVVIGAGVAAHALVGGLAFGALLQCNLLPRREVILLSSLAAFLCLDAITNSTVHMDEANLQSLSAKANGTSTNVVSQLKAPQITSFPHVVGRSALICSLAIAAATWATKRCFTQRWSLAFVALVALCVSGTYLGTRVVISEDPALWLWVYVHSRPLRLHALLLWGTGIPIAVLLVRIFGSGLPKAVFRKLYHLIALAAFAPLTVLDAEFMGFAICIATALAVILETARAANVRGTAVISRFVLPQIDARDGNGIVRTHIYLIFGFGMSIILRHRAELLLSRPTPLPLRWMGDMLPGVVGLGLVDAFAAIGGTLLCMNPAKGKASLKGSRGATQSEKKSTTTLSRWMCGRFFTELQNPALTHKTPHGLVCGALAGCAAWAFLFLVLGVSLLSKWFVGGVIVVVLSAIFECLCDGIDNLELPLIAYAISCAVSWCVYV